MKITQIFIALLATVSAIPVEEATNNTTLVSAALDGRPGEAPAHPCQGKPPSPILVTEGGADSRSKLMKKTDHLLYGMNFLKFHTQWDKRKPKKLIFKNGTCVNSVVDPNFSFGYEAACFRFDFGEGNFKAQQRWNRVALNNLLAVFASDARCTCRGPKKPHTEQECLEEAGKAATRLAGIAT